MNNLDLANHTPVYDHLGRIVSLADREALESPKVDWDTLPFGVECVQSQETSATDAQPKSPENS